MTKESLECTEGETACAEVNVAELPVESSYSINTGKAGPSFYPQSQYGSFASSQFINQPASTYGSQYYVQTQEPEEDENAIWSKVVAMQLRRMPAYEAAKLRLQIDSVILKAMKPSAEK